MKLFFPVLLSFWLWNLIHADTPISSLPTATTANPKLDGIPFLDASDKSQSRNGTTKKISPGSLEKIQTGMVNVRAAGAVGDGSTDDATAFTTAFASSYDVLVPAGYTFYLGSHVTVPAGTHLRIAGTVSGPGGFTFSGSARVDGGGTVNFSQDVEPRKFKLYQGDIAIKDLRFVGSSTSHPWCIVTINDGTSKTISSLIVEGCTAINCGYFVLREGGAITGSTVKRATIANNVVVDTTEADAIEWNDAPGSDTQVVITGNIIDGVTYSGAGGTGMGIGYAGDYPVPVTMANPAADAIISNNTVRKARVGIHAEYSKRVRISGNSVSLIAKSYSPAAALNTSGIEAFGVWDLTINGNFVSEVDNDLVQGWGLLIGGGYYASVYSSNTRNAWVGNNVLRNASVYIETQPQTSTANSITAYELDNVQDTALIGNRISNGALYIKGRGMQTLRGNDVWTSISKLGTNGAFSTKALYLDPQFYFGPNFDSRYRWNLIAEGNRAADEYGVSSFGVSSSLDSGSIVAGNQLIQATANNFGVASTYNRFSSANRTHYVSGTNVPYGPEFVTGDLLIGTGGTWKALVTTGGTSVPGTNTYQVYTSASGIIARGGTSIDWTTTHTVGQRLTLTYSGGSTNVIVRKIYYDFSAPNNQAIEVVSPTTGAACNLSGVLSGTITATSPITVQTF